MALDTIEYVGGPYCGTCAPVRSGEHKPEIVVPMGPRLLQFSADPPAPDAKTHLRVGRYRLNHTDHRGLRPVHVYEWMGEE
jgi:hypothetical protein